MNTMILKSQSKRLIKQTVDLMQDCSGMDLMGEVLTTEREPEFYTVTTVPGAPMPASGEGRRIGMQALWRYFGKLDAATLRTDKSVVMYDFTPDDFRFATDGTVRYAGLTSWLFGPRWENRAMLAAWAEEEGIDLPLCPEVEELLPRCRRRVHNRRAADRLSHQVTAVLLAGGKSSRMEGSPKHQLYVRGYPMWQNTVHAMRRFPNQVASVAYPWEELEGELLQWEDEVPDLGPVGGLCTVLERADTPLVLVVPCDLPLLMAEDLDRLCAAWSEEVDAVAALPSDDPDSVPRTGEDTQALRRAGKEERMNPLVCLLRREPALQAARKALAEGRRSAAAVLEQLRCAAAPIHREALTNINTREEFLALMLNPCERLDIL